MLTFNLARCCSGFALLLILLSVVACRRDDGGVIRINPKSFSAEDEAAIGRRLLSERWRSEDLNIIRPNSDAFTDAAFVYLEGLTRALIEQPSVTRRDSFDWEISLVLDEEAHAYTLPGGKIVLHTGLLHSIENEAECVGILAREVALAEQGAAMAALDREVEDNVTLGDMILGNLVPLDHIIETLPRLTYTAEELIRADSLAARLVCPTDYQELALLDAAGRLSLAAPYRLARPAEEGWERIFTQRVSACVGADSLYTGRYQEVLDAYVPN